MSQHAILVYGWPPPHCLKELCPHFTGQKVHSCPVSLPGWSVGYLLALNTPRIFACWFFKGRENTDHIEMGICHCDLQRAKDYCRGLKGQGLLQGFKEGFLQNHSGESFPSNTGCFLFHPHPHLHFTYTNVPCPSIRASLISPNPNFPSLKYLFRVNFQVCEVGMPQEKTPQIHEFCFGKCQECNNNHSKIVNNHKNHQKSTTIIKHHQKSRNIIIFLGDFSHTQPFPLPGRGLSESLAPGQVKIAHTSLEMDWDWMIPWVWCVFIDFYFFDFCFCVVYVWCGENVLLFCLLSHCLSVTGHPLGW